MFVDNPTDNPIPAPHVGHQFPFDRALDAIKFVVSIFNALLFSLNSNTQTKRRLFQTGATTGKVVLVV